MKNKFQKIRAEFLEKLKTVSDVGGLRELELQYLSRKGELSSLMHELKDLSVDMKKELGALANNIKNELETTFNEVKDQLDKLSVKNALVDITVPGVEPVHGHLNPITIIQREMEDIFSSLGFTIFDGPELESDYFNFTALNIPPFHPARDMQDTFYVDSKNQDGDLDLVMRTHTSPVQIRAMRKLGAPLKVVVPGRCFNSISN